MKNHQGLEVWQKSMDLVIKIYNQTKNTGGIVKDENNHRPTQSRRRRY